MYGGFEEVRREDGFGRAGAEERAAACDRCSMTALVCDRGSEDVEADVKSAARHSYLFKAYLTVSVTISHKKEMRIS
jgi:hypothetical protein